MIRMATDRLGGTTYTFTNVNAFLANQPSTIQFLGDESAPSVFNNGATGPRHIEQEYYIGYAQDEWRANAEVHVELRRALRLLHAVARSERPAGQVQRRHRRHRSAHDAGPEVDEDELPAARRRDVFADDQDRRPRGLRACSSDRARPRIRSRRSPTPIASASTISSGAALAFPLDPSVATAKFVNNPNNRNYQPRAYRNDYTIPERIWQYTGLDSAGSGRQHGRDGRLRRVAGTQSVPAQHRESDRRGRAPIRIPPARRSSFVSSRSCSAMRPATSTGVQNPYAEIDTKTSGGHDNYNALQLGLTRRSSSGVAVNAQYTLSRSFGNTSGSNEALTVGNAAQTLADFDYDLGYNAFDVRHTFNVSALYSMPYGRGREHWRPAWPARCSAAGMSAASSTRAAGCRSTSESRVRTSSTSDAAGSVFNNPAAGRTP